MKEQPSYRMYAEDVKIISRDFVVPGFVGGISRTQAGILQPISCHVAESCVPATEVHVVGIGLIIVSMCGVHDVVETGGLRHIERAQKQCIENAEDDNVRSNTERQRQQGGRRKCGRLQQLTHRITKILTQASHNVTLRFAVVRTSSTLRLKRQF